MDKTEIIKKQNELRRKIFRVYTLEKELTQEFVATHPDIVGAALKYKSGDALTFKKVTGILSYDSFQPALILQCIIDKITFTDTAECVTGLVEDIPFDHFTTYRTTSEDYEKAARDFIKELCQGPKLTINDKDIDFDKINMAQVFNKGYYILDPLIDTDKQYPKE